MIRRGVVLVLLSCVALATAPLSAGAAQGAPDIDALRSARGPFDSAIPKPELVLGFYPGADFRLADWPTILDYLRQLDAASDRIELRDIGVSAEGQPLVVALISDPANLRDAERYRSISERLARARDLSDADAQALAVEGKAIVWIDSGLHATEVAHGQHAPELAYMLAAGHSDELQRMLRDVIVVLMPNMNPDGLNIVVDWYNQNLGTPFETAGLPVLYQKYSGHDNNRDWYMITQPETQAVAKQLYEVWYPQIVYNHHQTAPFPARIFVPPFADPSNPNIPPLVLRGIARVGNAITTRLESEGKAGAVSRLGFTAWWNGGMRTAPYFHNMVGILTETALFRYATPNFYPPNSLPDSFRDGASTRDPSINYPMPWPGGWWRLRDAVEYMLTASFATIDVGSRYREDWLLNIYRMGRDAVRRGATGSPAAWVIGPEQHDAGSAVELVNVLRRGGVEVNVADAPFEADGSAYPAGSFVVPAAQAFASYAADLLEPQNYPDRRLYPDGPPDPPYDIAGWTLPFQMGVDVDRIVAPFEASMERIDVPVTVPGRLEGQGSTYVLDPRSNASARAVNELLAAGHEVYRSSAPVDAGGVRLGPGALIVPDGPGVAARLAQLAEDNGLVIRSIARRPRGEGWLLRAPRVGLYEPWVASMDAGWTRFVLEGHGFGYDVLRDPQVRKGKLNDAYDVILLPSAGAEALIDGQRPGNMPAAYTGGLGDAGITALRRFVEAGGTLVTFDAAGALAIDRLGVPVSNPISALEREEFYCPGSLLRINVDNTHPVAFGMPSEATAVFVRSSGYEVVAKDGVGESSRTDVGDGESPVRVIASYAEGDLLESGWILGEEHLRGLGAAVEVPMGSGRIIMLGFRTHFRAQPHETFKLLFNSIFYGAAEAVSLP